jgi:hypothetical protein
MLLHLWQRQHSSGLVTQVELQRVGTWRASVCRVEPPACPFSHADEFRLLHIAEAEADALARQMFGHQCADETCGDWHPVPSD